jgi:hypothetical protein
MEMNQSIAISLNSMSNHSTNQFHNISELIALFHSFSIFTHQLSFSHADTTARKLIYIAFLVYLEGYDE